MDDRKDTTLKGPVNYLIRVGSKVGYCHTKVVHDNKRNIGSADWFMPIENDIETNAKPTVIFMPRKSYRIRQPPRGLIEKMNS